MDSTNQSQSSGQDVTSDQQVITQVPTQANSNPVSGQPADQLESSVNQQVPEIQISGPSKEGSPVITQPISQETKLVAVTDQELVLSPEVKEAGVTAIPNPEQVDIDPEVKAAGVTPEKTAVPVQTTPSNKIQLPMTEEEAKKTIKSHPAVDAAYGFGIEVLKQLKRLHKGLFNQTP